MKTQAEMMAYFASMPKKKRINPYWAFDPEKKCIVTAEKPEKVLQIEKSVDLLKGVRQYFRNVFQSYKSEAQVLCVTEKDQKKLTALGIPELRCPDKEQWTLGGIRVHVMVLPQYNTAATSQIDEAFWQHMIIDNQIVPVARIHSHHILEAYQSSTDYRTLNSNSLEIVMGRIEDSLLQAAFWLDQHGTNTKDVVIRMTELEPNNFDIIQIPCGKPKMI